MAEYNWDFKIKTELGREVLVDSKAKYGYWEHLDGSEGGGLWFETAPEPVFENRLELVDYDGCMALPSDIEPALQKAGFLIQGD